MVLRCLFLQKFVSLHKIGGTSAIKQAYGVRLALSLHKIGAEITICTILTVKVCAQTVITKTKKDEKMKYLERAIDGELKNWSESENHKPLLLRGARQVGKTSAVRHLGERFKHYVEIDLNDRQDLHTLFEKGYSPQQICQQLSVILDTPIEEGNTLLFFDEIQACPAAINRLRYFYEKMPLLHVIAAGSLLEFALRDLPSFGVGRIRSLFMYSFSFQEFLWALDKRTLADMVVQATPEDPLPELIHAKALEYLRVFLVIGGMPECVARYVETGSMLKCQQILSELMISYQDDFKKYHEKIPVNVLRDVLRSVALQGQGKFVYTQVGSDYRTPVVKEALDMLCMAGLIYTVVHTDSNGVPLYAEAKEKYKRYIFMDTGLLQRTLELDLTDILVSDDIKLVNRGALAEVFVGNELVKSRPPYLNDNLYCWHREKKNSNAEVDYVVSRKGRIYPIEVKAGVRGTMQSMRIFMDAKQLDKGIRTSLENFGEFDDILIYPLYAIGNICR